MSSIDALVRPRPLPLSLRTAAAADRPLLRPGAENGPETLPDSTGFPGPPPLESLVPQQVPAASRAGSRRAYLWTSSPALRASLEEICAAAELPVAPAGGSAPRPGDVVLVDAEGEDPVPPPGGTCPVLVSTREDRDLWVRATVLRNCPVVVLPEGAAWLADHLTALVRQERHRSAERATTVGLVGAVGGAGTTTLACWLAQQAGIDGRRCLVVDADPAGQGVDILLGTEGQGGLRWTDLPAGTAPDPAGLWTALPRTGHFRYLSRSRRTSSVGAEGASYAPSFAGGVLEACQEAAELVVVDLGRAEDPACPELVSRCDRLVLVTPRTVRGVWSARSLGLLLGHPATSVVTTGLDFARLGPSLVAETVGLPVVGQVRFDGRVPEASESGLVLEVGRQRRRLKELGALLRGIEDRR